MWLCKFQLNLKILYYFASFVKFKIKKICMPIEHCRIFYFKIETLKLSDFDPFFLFIENQIKTELDNPNCGNDLPSVAGSWKMSFIWQNLKLPQGNAFFIYYVNEQNKLWTYKLLIAFCVKFYGGLSYCSLHDFRLYVSVTVKFIVISMCSMPACFL